MNIVSRGSFVSVSLPRAPFRSALACLCVWGAIAGGAQARTAVDQTYYERSFVLAADKKCGLFDAGINQALQAAALQTRGTLLRQGYAPSDVSAMAQTARDRADQTACGDAELQQVRGRIDNAFGLWTRAARINFPAQREGWAVDRFRGVKPGWRMVQRGQVGASPVLFGLAGNRPDEVQPMAVVSFAGRSRPYAARIVMRDESRMPRPHLIRSGFADVPPPSARKAMFAAGQSVAPASLLATGKRQGEAWLFDPAVMEALSALDPRETFLIEFLFRDDTVARVRMEAGDLGAARAFLAMGPVA